ncbi:MAG: hypothetical protein QM621_11450 [Aeromicrobium sp.]|uniref:hypothetical protein n=1 Tax=Aeromicrobium sp. TaxID=1871063 RepID=UPI0039E265AF
MVLMSPSAKHTPRGSDRPLAAVALDLGFRQSFAERDASDSTTVRDALDWLNNQRPQQQNHWPALSLAFVAQIESLLESIQIDRVEKLLSSYPPQKPEPSKAVNTLNLETPDGDFIRLRPFYNKAFHVIRNVMLRDHPSNPGHATQSWPAYSALIEMIAAMRPKERRLFAELVWESGVLDKPTREIALVQERITRPFEKALMNMPTAVKGVRGGAILQGLTYGYLRADSPNLILESHTVNAGSSRTGMLGDVDGFRGREPELAVEVKDLSLNMDNVEKQVSDFLEDITIAPNVTPLVVCASISDEAREFIEKHGVTVLTRFQLAERVAVWDLPKQHEALRGAEYYFGRIQKDDKLVEIFRDWLGEQGLSHDLGAGHARPTDPGQRRSTVQIHSAD